MWALCLLLALAQLDSSSAEMRNLVLSSGVREVGLTSLYVWKPGEDSKGRDLLAGSLSMDSCISVLVPAGRFNILVFDELGNSYAYRGLEGELPDTLRIDNSMITYQRPNIDLGSHMLNLTNSLQGFPIDSILLAGPDGELLELGGFRIFPGSSLILWLDPGQYDITVMDGTGRWLRPGGTSIPSDTSLVSVGEEDLCDPEPPLGICGDGDATVLVENRVWRCCIVELEVEGDKATPGLLLENIRMEPGDGIVIQLDAGDRLLRAVDADGMSYSLDVRFDPSTAHRYFISNADMVYDFGFPGDEE